jgi:uncharacterized phage protein (TIGR02218 family)
MSLLSTRELGEVLSAGPAFRAELRSLAARLDQPSGRLYGKRCDADLGDARCGVNLSVAPFRLEGAVVSVPDEMSLIVSGLGDRPAGLVFRRAGDVRDGVAARREQSMLQATAWRPGVRGFRCGRPWRGHHHRATW